MNKLIFTLSTINGKTIIKPMKQLVNLIKTPCLKPKLKLKLTYFMKSIRSKKNRPT